MRSGEPRLNVYILNWNGGDALPACIEAVQRSEGIAPVVYVVDNDSSDAVEDLVLRTWPDALFLSTGSNAGYAAALNLGVAKRRLDGPVLVLNPDARLRGGALTGMLAWYRAMRRWRPEGDLRVHVPTLILWGDRDHALAPGLAEASLALCDDGRIQHIREATHWVQHDAHAAVNAALMNFLTV